MIELVIINKRVVQVWKITCLWKIYKTLILDISYFMSIILFLPYPLVAFVNTLFKILSINLPWKTWVPWLFPWHYGSPSSIKENMLWKYSNVSVYNLLHQSHPYWYKRQDPHHHRISICWSLTKVETIHSSSNTSSHIWSTGLSYDFLQTDIMLA